MRALGVPNHRVAAALFAIATPSRPDRFCGGFLRRIPMWPLMLDFGDKSYMPGPELSVRIQKTHHTPHRLNAPPKLCKTRSRAPQGMPLPRHSVQM
ncbi:MAG: hypothetical protein BJ554DRAFT_4787 [Olpidium bornovanus]|uniref:Uncharacterized protein n=1 Tax=Olpidium bornovanus TaxID=278681 RepID=A0A8H8DEL8_9FUNG|nr:MAG: hypothetical protein BJ554DRAFT_4787 [Olpidium bornovanus]